MLAEDSRADVLIVREALDSHGIRYELMLAEDGAAAIEMVERLGKPDGMPCPDLLLLDLNLPKADGVEVLTAFRKNDSCSKTPVIVVSSSDAARDRERVAQFGIDQYFRKPAQLDEFLELGSAVRRVLEHAS